MKALVNLFKVIFFLLGAFFAIGMIYPVVGMTPENEFLGRVGLAIFAAISFLAYWLLSKLGKKLEARE